MEHGAITSGPGLVGLQLSQWARIGLVKCVNFSAMEAALAKSPYFGLLAALAFKSTHLPPSGSSTRKPIGLWHCGKIPDTRR
jgi:hypothetical protein